ncbi:MAG TPA: hypothetical protein VH520_11635, partial [Streptosporangiaceae bacterium]
MQQELAPAGTLPARGRHRARQRRPVIATVLAVAVVVLVAGLAVGIATPGRGGARKPPPAPAAVVTRDPAAAVTALPGTAAATAAGLASALFARAPAVVVTSTSAGVDAAAIARRVHAPLLLAPAPGSASDQAALLAAVRSLRPKAVLAAGLSVRALAQVLPGIRVVASAGSLPATKPPVPVPTVALLVDQADSAELDLAVGTTAQVAGATVVATNGPDPRADSAAISALAAGKPRYVIGVGAGFTSQPLL